MSRDDDRRAIAEQHTAQHRPVPKVNVLPPIGVMNLARRMSHLGQHQHQMFPHGSSDPLSLDHRQRGKRMPQVVLDDVLPDLEHVAHDPRQPACQTAAGVQRQGLHHADEDADHEVDEIVADADQRHGASLRRWETNAARASILSESVAAGNSGSRRRSPPRESAILAHSRFGTEFSWSSIHECVPRLAPFLGKRV